jgi:toluene monooxygenase system protein E
MNARRTWWNLEKSARKPSDYDIASTGLLYYPGRGFEVRTPMEEWYRRYQTGSPLRCADWDRFRDPAEMTYSRYVEARRDKEVYVEGLLKAAAGADQDRRLSPGYLHLLDRILCPLRYPFHGLQMVSAYLGSMAPGGRLAICLLLETGDEIRRVQRIAYRMRQLQEIRPGLGTESRYCWEWEPMWQPLRRAVEKLLVTYDWGEAFAALNLALKPALDEVFLIHFARAAVQAGDEALGNILLSFHEDCRWQREWTAALVRMLTEEAPGNAAALAGWCGKWQPLAEEAACAFAPALAAAGLDGDFIRDGVRGALGISRGAIKEATHAG